MSPVCPSYTAPPSFQLVPGAGPTGPADCTAHAAAVSVAASTCGHKTPTGRRIRELSSEPVPDPQSPGLNLPQVAAVALGAYGVNLDVRIGFFAVPWAEYERRRNLGQPTIIQVGYGPIADSPYDAGRGFRRNHALAETAKVTYDSLADGRPGAFRWDGSLYTRSVIRKAASQLDVGNGHRPAPGTVWAAFGPDVVPALPSIPYGPSVAAAIRALDPPGRSAAVWIMRTGHAFGGQMDLSDFEAALKRAGIAYGGTVNVGDVLRLRDWRP